MGGDAVVFSQQSCDKSVRKCQLVAALTNTSAFILAAIVHGLHLPLAAVLLLWNTLEMTRLPSSVERKITHHIFPKIDRKKYCLFV